VSWIDDDVGFFESVCGVCKYHNRQFGWPMSKGEPTYKPLSTRRNTLGLTLLHDGGRGVTVVSPLDSTVLYSISK
jgi:hypothetical protein